jgi:hypothetical protein
MKLVKHDDYANISSFLLGKCLCMDSRAGKKLNIPLQKEGRLGAESAFPVTEENQLHDLM